MNVTPVEHKRVQLTTGSSLQDQKLKHLALRHPFTQQERETRIAPFSFKQTNNKIDVIFPTSSALENDLEKSLKAPRYVRGKVCLAKVVEGAAHAGFISSYDTRSGLSILSVGSGLDSEDVWCIDYRGVLTLSVCKDTYEKLGLVGKKVGFSKGKGKQGDERHVISISLYAKDAESVKERQKRVLAFKQWDERRERERDLEPNAPSWDVLCFSESESEELETAFLKLGGTSQNRVISVDVRKLKTDDVKIPVVQLLPRPAKQREAEDEDWSDAMEALFEWVGMAGLGAQRLRANDRVDPFVALHDVPSPSVVGSITHISWTGFLSSSFVRAVMDTVSQYLSQREGTHQFCSVTCHMCTWSPVSYIPPKFQSPASGGIPSPPVRDPTRDVEDSYSVVMVSGGGENAGCAWALAESVGKFDARWG